MSTGLLTAPNGAFIHPDDPGEPGYVDQRKRWSVTPREMDILATLARGRRVLEIGTGLGLSARAMALSASHVVTIDVDEWVAREIAPALPESVTFHARREDVLLDDFSLVFIDGCHITEAVASDIAWALTKVSRPALLIFHDMKIPSVRDAVKAAVDAGAFNHVYVMPTECGLGVAILGPTNET